MSHNDSNFETEREGFAATLINACTRAFGQFLTNNPRIVRAIRATRIGKKMPIIHINLLHYPAIGAFIDDCYNDRLTLVDVRSMQVTPKELKEHNGSAVSFKIGKKSAKKSRKRGSKPFAIIVVTLLGKVSFGTFVNRSSD